MKYIITAAVVLALVALVWFLIMCQLELDLAERFDTKLRHEARIVFLECKQAHPDARSVEYNRCVTPLRDVLIWWTEAKHE